MNRRLLMAAAAGLVRNYYGNRELGNCQFSTGGITQTGDTVAIDTKLTTGSEAGGPGASSYGEGDNAPPGSNVYEFTVPSKNGSYDGDMFVAQFRDLTIDANVWLTTDQPCRGLLVYVDGHCVINGKLSMSCRGACADPTAAGGSDNSAVSATGIRLPLRKGGGSDTLAAADFAGCGTPAVNAAANQDGISGNGTVFTAARAGSAGGARGDNGNGYVGQAGTGSEANKAGGGGGGSGHPDGNNGGNGAAGTCFSGGAGGGSAGSGGGNGDAAAGAANGCAGGNAQNVDGSARGGAGNPGGTGHSSDNGTGGLLILIVKGDLTIGAAGEVVAKGAGTASVGGTYGAGSSGGGRIGVFYAGSLTNSGSVSAAGGPTENSTHRDGGAGGTGDVDGPTLIDK